MALYPEQLKDIPNNIVSIYQELEDYILKDFARRIKKAGTVTDTAKWQALKAKEIGISINRIKKETERITELSMEELDKLFNDAALESINNDNKIYESAGLSPLKIEKNSYLNKIIKAAIKQTNKELFNLTQSMGFSETIGGKTVYKPIAKYYHDALDFAQFQILSGATDYNSAIKNAVKKLSNSGLKYVDYESGWANRLDVAVRRATLTGSNQMAQKMTIIGIEESGCEYVETSAHSGARPSHATWQGQVFSWKGNNSKYPNFEESTGYGKGDGLGGWNCRHSFQPFYPGISVRTYTDEQLKKIDPPNIEYNGVEYTHYEATQRQRRLETLMRKTKRELIMFKDAGLEEDFKTSSIKLNRQKEYYKDFSRAAGLPLQSERHQVLGYDRSISQKAVQAERNVYLSKMKGLGIENPPKTSKKFAELKIKNPKEYKILEGYINAVEKGDISPLIGYNKYKEISKEIENKLVGITTTNGIVINNYSVHFVDRVIGQYIESDTIQTGKRKGVLIEDIIDTLINPIKIGDVQVRADGKKSLLIKGNKCDVSINPDTNTLIQTNPIRAKKGK